MREMPLSTKKSRTEFLVFMKDQRSFTFVKSPQNYAQVPSPHYKKFLEHFAMVLLEAS
jgi:hypothetical protein